MKKKNDKLIKELSNIFEKKNLSENDRLSDLENFDSIIILQIMNLAKTQYKKNITGIKIAKCKKITEIINLII